LVSVALSSHHCLVLTAEGAVFSWLHNEDSQEGEGFQVDGHDFGTAPYNLLGRPDGVDEFRPNPIAAVAGQRICSIAASDDTSIVAGWLNTSEPPAEHHALFTESRLYEEHTAREQVGEADRPQWACWSWGTADAPEWGDSAPRFGRGPDVEFRQAPIPGRVWAVGIPRAAQG
tara:strand:+ start:647 stop:1165 length:519 start_codon:yes stop_codon:yes gene_type:complete